MEATLQQGAHQAMGMPGAFARQFGLLWTSRRPILLVVAVLGILALTGPPFVERGALGDLTVARLLPIWGVFVILIGPIWAFAVFNAEGPSSRLYHWSQPVSRTTHSLARIAAGAAWLIIVYVILLLGGFLFGTIDGNAWQLAALPGDAWVNFFTGPLLGYLGVSVVTLLSDHPLRWFFGLVFLLPLVLGLVLSAMGLEQVFEAFARPVTHPEWGFGYALGGAFAHGAADMMAEATRGSSPVRAHGAFTWLRATLLWGLGLAALVVLAASRHPDTLPRWPWSR